MIKSYTRPRILIKCDQDFGTGKMNALGLRGYHFARVLAQRCDVTLVTTGAAKLEGEPFRVHNYRTKRDLSMLLASCDIVLCQGINPPWLPTIVRSGKRLILDEYAPSFEILERFPGINESLLTLMYARTCIWEKTTTLAADLVLAANEKHADFLLGFMHATGKLNASIHRKDPSVRSLVEVVPYGLPEERPKHTRPALKGVVPGVQPNDFVLLWNSGIWGWLDAATLIRAMHKLWSKRPDIKLVFLGLGDITDCGRRIQDRCFLANAREAVSLSKKLGVYGKNVIFLFERVPPSDVQNFLLETDIGISTYPDSLETRLCLGSRLLDFIWAGVPVLTSSAPLMDELVLRNRIGLTVKCCDPEELAAKIVLLANDEGLREECRQNMKNVAQTLTWESLLRPLKRYCENYRDYPRPLHGHALSYAYGIAMFFYYSGLVRSWERLERWRYGQ